MKTIPVIILAAALALSSCSRGEWRQTSGAAWGTTYHITYCADVDLADSVVAEMRRVELSVSMFDPASTISKVNAGSDTVDLMFAEVFQAAKTVNRLSGGAFDPTVAPLVNFWGFGYRKGECWGETAPDSVALAAELAKVGMADCRLDGLRLVRRHPETEFDFSAIAKGYGVDRVAAMLRRNGATDYMVEIGGEVVTSGANPSGETWRIQIDAPTSAAPGDSALRVIGLVDAAVATSGNYRNYRFYADGSRYGHTISPLTGYPVESRTLSATVIAPTCTMADALATACMVMHPDSAIVMIGRIEGAKALIVEAGDDGYVFHSTLE